MGPVLAWLLSAVKQIANAALGKVTQALGEKIADRVKKRLLPAADQGDVDWKELAMEARRLLRSGRGNVIELPDALEEFALWAEEKNLLQIEWLGPKLLVCLPGRSFRRGGPLGWSAP